MIKQSQCHVRIGNIFLDSDVDKDEKFLPVDVWDKWNLLAFFYIDIFLSIRILPDFLHYKLLTDDRMRDQQHNMSSTDDTRHRICKNIYSHFPFGKSLQWICICFGQLPGTDQHWFLSKQILFNINVNLITF